MTTQVIRNIGISAHIDAGKTTLAERILFYTGRIHQMGEVHGKNGVGATMDSDPIEARKGITIKTAAVSCDWNDARINLVDTPGHVDFTVEVERALRVLDGAVLVLSAVHGVQAQTVTVDQQRRRYEVPALAFVNKTDLAGADPARVVAEVRERLGHNAVLTQLPLGTGPDLEGIIDLIDLKVLRFGEEHGEVVETSDVPEDMTSVVTRAREALLDAVSLHSERLTEALLEGGPVDLALVHDAIRTGVREHTLLPVLIGSAYRNVGVQPLLDAIVRWLPAPSERTWTAVDDHNETVSLSASPSEPTVALVFNLQDGQHGTVSWVRVVQGTLVRGQALVNTATGRKVRVGRLLRLDPRGSVPIESAEAGDICAAFGVDAVSGDALCENVHVTFPQMFVAEPMVELRAELYTGKPSRLARALARFTREDPTFRATTDSESGELRLKGVGELQLEVYVERLETEYDVVVRTGAPTVAQRQTVATPATFDHLFKKQDGGRGMYARIAGRIEPLEGTDVDVVWAVTGGSIPSEYRSAVERGFREAIASGVNQGIELVGVRIVIEDGAAHEKDSSDLTFQIAAGFALRDAVAAAGAVDLEPIALVEATAPEAHHGAVLKTLSQRGGQVTDAVVEGGQSRVTAEVPLAQMFGYTGTLRSATAGAGAFSMQFARFAPAR